MVEEKLPEARIQAWLEQDSPIVDVERQIAVYRQAFQGKVEELASAICELFEAPGDQQGRRVVLAALERLLRDHQAVLEAERFLREMADRCGQNGMMGKGKGKGA